MTMDLARTVPFETRDGTRLTARRLTRGDRAALQRFYAELSPQSRRWFAAHATDDDTVDKALARSESGDDLTLGLFDGERMVGYFFLWRCREPVPLLGIGLADDYQRRGLGRPLMRFLMDRAEADGADGIELTTMRDNDRAYALYEKMGFRHYKDVDNLQGTGEVVVERAMFYPIKPGAEPVDMPHAPPV